MSKYKPGELPDSALVEVEPGIFLATRQARAYRRAKAAFRQAGKKLTIIGKYAAYRSGAVQDAMRAASLSPKGSAARLKYNLSSSSTVPLAAHPNGTHETGTRFDLLINGSSRYPSSADRALLAKHGWIFEFQDRDPNHVAHDNKHSVLPVTRAWCIKNGLFVQPK